MRDAILIVTNRHDLHADLVEEKVRERAGAPFRLNLDEFPDQFCVDLQYAGARWRGGLSSAAGGPELDISRVGAVWMRKAGAFAYRSQGLSAQERAYADEEMDHLLFSLLYSLDCRWMSHPVAIRGALWKGEQLQRAARMGFRTPRSIVTSSREAVDAFRRTAKDGVVFKALSSSLLAADSVDAEDRIASGLPTSLLDGGAEDLLDAVSELPCFFQEYVVKQLEVRATVIGERVFAANIHSQDDPRTAVDFRDFSAEIDYEPANLPLPVENLCREFVRSYGLNYGAIDLLLTPDGEYVFLENNPVGQFLFVEQLVPELRMTDAVADWLTSAPGAQPE